MKKLIFDPPPQTGKFYFVKLRNAKIGELAPTYLCKFHEITNDHYQVTYQRINRDNNSVDNSITTTWKKDEISIVSFEPADVKGFYKI